MKQDMINYLMKNPQVLTKLENGEASLIGIPDKLIPSLLGIFNREMTLSKKQKGIFWEQ
ncbi:competence pheromone ComX [Bacillus vallismortis]|uniref:ComX pheromone n=2 Tax=Bacillus subtilis group TaxID=653685 RepID=Q8VQA2_BACIU|nr:competence pheromone ComX [Bacillus vallismortis]AAL59649.1 pre-ComX [Bacillus subtilis]ABB16427.1 pre-ComX [Bacillus spizizenii str. W23]MBG9769529.1 competence protein [Bacillus vallismortis]MCI3985503.1 competence pheromone ComX [Bacillus vallismortis]MCI4138278.1 competence pheromone ComX [Bacillus vallismortis]